MTRAYTEQNRRAWDEIAEVRHKAMSPPSSQGGTPLDARVLQAAEPVAGKTVLHLQCSTGAETLAWAAAGARATGVDISERQIEIARQTAQAARLPVRFVASDVYTLPPDLLQAGFDIVYTGGGALVWLPALEPWAKTVAMALQPGGLLILLEEHPVAGCLWVENGVLQLDANYFGRSSPDVVHGWSHFGGEAAQEPKYEFSWPLGDVVTALAQAGLRIERLEEYPGAEGWRFGDKLDQVRRLPGEYLLLARKTAETQSPGRTKGENSCNGNT
jgi:SAM-dependent methyltransferase